MLGQRVNPTTPKPVMLGQRLNNPPLSYNTRDADAVQWDKGDYILFDPASEAQVLWDKGELCTL
jgi:hypothetical protein